MSSLGKLAVVCSLDPELPISRLSSVRREHQIPAICRPAPRVHSRRSRACPRPRIARCPRLRPALGALTPQALRPHRRCARKLHTGPSRLKRPTPPAVPAPSRPPDLPLLGLGGHLTPLFPGPALFCNLLSREIGGLKSPWNACRGSAGTKPSCSCSTRTRRQQELLVRWDTRVPPNSAGSFAACSVRRRANTSACGRLRPHTGSDYCVQAGIFLLSTGLNRLRGPISATGLRRREPGQLWILGQSDLGKPSLNAAPGAPTPLANSAPGRHRRTDPLPESPAT